MHRDFLITLHILYMGDFSGPEDTNDTCGKMIHRDRVFNTKMIHRDRVFNTKMIHRDRVFNTKIIKYLSSNTSCIIVCEATCFGPYMTIIRPICESS